MTEKAKEIVKDEIDALRMRLKAFKLIEAADFLAYEVWPAADPYYKVIEILEGAFIIDGVDYTRYAEGCDLTACAYALEKYKADVEEQLEIAEEIDHEQFWAVDDE